MQINKKQGTKQENCYPFENAATKISDKPNNKAAFADTASQSYNNINGAQKMGEHLQTTA